MVELGSCSLNISIVKLVLFGNQPIQFLKSMVGQDSQGNLSTIAMRTENTAQLRQHRKAAKPVDIAQKAEPAADHYWLRVQ